MSGTHCTYVHPSGRACGGFAISGSTHCFAHAEGQEEKRAHARRRGGQAGHVATVTESDIRVRTLGDVLTLVELTINDVRSGRIDVRIANAIGVLANVASRTIQQADVEDRLAAVEAVLDADHRQAVALHRRR